MSERADEMAVTPERAKQLRENLTVTRERIAAATTAAGRTDEPTLIVVTKFFPVGDLIALADAGVRDIGENREQELLRKVEFLKTHRPELLHSVTCHFIGQIQSKKARHIAANADVVQTIDREKVLEKIAAFGAERVASGEEPVRVLLQVDLDGGDAARGGVTPAGLAALAEAAASADGVVLAGLMAVAPLGEEPASAFARLASVRERFLRDHPQATLLSAGMSSDLEEAVAIGATHLRVGSAILGSRATAM